MVPEPRLRIEQPTGVRVWLRLRWLGLRLTLRALGRRLGASLCEVVRGWRRDQWDPETVARLRQQFLAGQVCEHCGGLHAGKCPRIRRVVLSAGGAVAEVEYWPWGVWPVERVIWLTDLPEEKNE